MKRLFFIAMVVTIYFMVGLFSPRLIFAQTPLVSDSVYFYADSISTTITIGKNEWLAQIWVDSIRTLSVWPQFYEPNKGHWSWVDDTGSKLVYTTSDSALIWVIPLEPRKFFAGKKIRLLITNDPADTFTIRYDKRPF